VIGAATKTIVLVVTVLALIAAVASAAPATYSGEVWTWDSGRSIVTLYDAGRQFRVQVTPDQIARLQLHGYATVTGVLLGPDPIETVLVPLRPMALVPSGAATTVEVTGRITALEQNDVATIESARGPLRVWLADGAPSRFAVGRSVTMSVRVQPVRVVAVSEGGTAPGPTIIAPVPAAGDQSLVTGRILSVSPAGTLTVESPRGPISVWVPDVSNFRAGDVVQVHTFVQPR
jgi:hypothetical protein